MSAESTPSLRRYRRRILGWGAVLAVVVSLVTAVLANEWNVEPDLEDRVPEALADAGYPGVRAEFSGQDGTLICSSRLDDPAAALAVAGDVRGVRGVDLDESCGAADGAEVPGSTLLDVIRSDPQFSTFASLLDQDGFADVLAPGGSFTVFAPTDAAFESLPADRLAAIRRDPEILELVLGNHVVRGVAPSTSLTPGVLQSVAGRQLVITVDEADGTVRIDDATVIETDVNAANGVIHVIDGVLVPTDLQLDDAGGTPDTGTAGTAPAPPAAATAATFDGGGLTLTGPVASDDQRAAIVGALDGILAAESVDDQLTVDAAGGLDAAIVDAFARLVAAMPTNLVSGQVTAEGTALSITGVYVDDTANATLTGLASQVGATASLMPRPDATADQAAALEAELNEFVATNPILFESGSAQLTDAAEAVLDQIAAIAKRYAGVGITIEGHTDSDGPAEENQALSERRAQEVLDALVARGVPSGDVAAAGFGETQPVLVDGAEDKDRSRRVEFRVLTQ